MKSKIVLPLAIIMGLVTTFLFYNYMKAIDENVKQNNNMVDIVVANKEIKKNQRISSDMLSIIQVPEKGVHPNTIKTISEAEGKYTTADIAQGEALVSHRLLHEKEESLFISRKIKEGYRAVSVGVNIVQSVSNLIEPEDTVDVIFSETFQNGQTTSVSTQTILQNVRVLAVGRRMIESTPGEEYVEYTSVTLELNQWDAVTLVNAKERGNIQLILHSRVIPPKEAESNATKSNQ
ncbi:MAG: Flp pilus assembly protein CpaB [Bacillota bacterium]